jgi:hemoglobin-like flavoprotein
MNLSNEQKKLVEQSFAFIVSQKKNIGDKFYSYLFALKPDLKELFQSDIKEQSKKLEEMLHLIVQKIDDNELKEILSDLGKKHVSYGVAAYDYQFVGQALILTFKDIMGGKWNNEIENSWIAVYSLISTKMHK